MLKVDTILAGIEVIGDFVRLSADLARLAVWGAVHRLLPKHHAWRISPVGPYCDRDTAAGGAADAGPSGCNRARQYYHSFWFHLVCPATGDQPSGLPCSPACQFAGPFRVRPVFVISAAVVVVLFWGTLGVAVWGGCRVARSFAQQAPDKTAPAASGSSQHPLLLGPLDYLQRAQARLAAGQAQEARIEAKNAVQEDPSCGDAYRVLGEASFRCGLRREAQAAFEKAAKIGGADGLAEIALAHLARFSGEFEAMERWAASAVTVASNNVEALTLLSEAQEMRGDVKSALATAKRAYSLSPGETNAVLRLADAELIGGNLTEAERLYRTRLDANPGDLNGRAGLARIRLARKDVDGAIAELSLILKSDPQNSAVVAALSTAYLSRNDFTALGTLYKRFSADQPRLFMLRAQWARVLLSAGRINDAHDEAARLLHDHPDDVQAHLVLGDLFLRGGLWTLAEQQAAQAIQLEPKMIDGHRLLACVLMCQGKTDRAVSELGNARKIDASDIATLILLSTCLQQLGQDREATQILELASKAHPESPAPFGRLGELQVHAGHYDAAVANFRQALARGGTNALLLNNLAMALARTQGPTDEALQLAGQARRLSPEDPRVLDTLGWIYLQRKEYRSADELLETAALMMPQDPTICLHLGSLLGATGQPDRAVRYLKAVGDRSRDAEEVRQAKVLMAALCASGVGQRGHD